MRRRAFIASLGCMTLIRRSADAQGAAHAVLIGCLGMSSRETEGHLLDAFREGMAALGQREGSEFATEARWADGRIERLPRLAAEIATLQPGLVVAWPTQSVAAISKAAPRTPIVQVLASNPVITGFAKSLAEPGGMVTGLSNAVTDFTEKLLELLVDAAPDPRRVGYLGDSTNFARRQFREAAGRSVTGQSGIEASFAEAGSPDEIEPALSHLAGVGCDALIVLASPLLTFERRRIIAYARAQNWPVAGSRREWADAGALLSYGSDSRAHFRRAATYAQRILAGAHPASLPIEEPTSIELVVNLRAAAALGMTIPPSFLARADEVIE
jgi:putative ABC transport system substrate-binding protein